MWHLLSRGAEEEWWRAAADGRVGLGEVSCSSRGGGEWRWREAGEWEREIGLLEGWLSGADSRRRLEAGRGMCLLGVWWTLW